MWRKAGVISFRLIMHRAAVSTVSSTMGGSASSARGWAFTMTPAVLGARSGIFLLGAGRVCGWPSIATVAGVKLKCPLGMHRNSGRHLYATVASSPKTAIEKEDEIAMSSGQLERIARVAENGKVSEAMAGKKFELSKNGILEGNGTAVEKEKVEGVGKDSEVEGFGPSIRKFRLSEETIKRLEAKEITHMTEVQAGTFDKLYDGHDVIARSRTGTGKTLAFALPILERMVISKKEEEGRPLGYGPGCIVLAPTRELAKQVGREMAHFGAGLGLTCEVIYGGASYNTQERALRRGVDVVVGTPGRVIDHLTRGTLDLSRVSFAVLDEADEMLSMGFAEDVETVFARLPPPEKRQAILFSATVPRWVKKLAARYQKPDVISFDSVSKGTTLTSTTVRHCAVCVPQRDEARAALLADIIAVYSGSIGGGTSSKSGRAIVFCETKREADELATSGSLEGCGAAVLHGDVTQKQREITLAQFRSGRFTVLVATDVAARGLDIFGVDLVVQYRIPDNNEAYIHRAGRTGRAGRDGTAIIMYSEREQYGLRAIERECGITFERSSAPSPSVALHALANAAVSALDDIDPKVIQALLPKAQEILSSSNDPAIRLAGVLALATRRTQMTERSLLTGESGMKTLRIQTKRRSSISHGFVLRFMSGLAERFGAERHVGLIRFCKDGSAVLDVPVSEVKKLIEGCDSLETDEVTLESIEVLPELAPDLRERGRYGRDGGDRRSERSGRGRYGRDFRGRNDGRYGRWYHDKEFAPRGRYGNERYDRGRSGFRGSPDFHRDRRQRGRGELRRFSDDY